MKYVIDICDKCNFETTFLFKNELMMPNFDSSALCQLILTKNLSNFVPPLENLTTSNTMIVTAQLSSRLRHKTKNSQQKNLTCIN